MSCCTSSSSSSDTSQRICTRATIEVKYQQRIYRTITICGLRREPITTRTLSSTAAMINMDPDLRVNCPACPRIRFSRKFQEHQRCLSPSTTLTVSSVSIKTSEISRRSNVRLTSRKPGRSMHQRPATTIRSSAARTTISPACPTPTSASSTKSKTGRIPRAKKAKRRISRSRAAT